MDKKEESIRKVYNNIANEFSATRYKQWPCVERFYKEYTKPGNYILDAGCGNGKNMVSGYFYECCDISENFLEISKEKNKNAGLVHCYLENLPFRERCFDHIICIAVLHHLKDSKLRQTALKLLERSLRSGGYICITNWAFENNKYSDIQDCYIPFRNSKNQILDTRYYHLFTENELEMLLSETNLQIIEKYNEHNNWIYILQSRSCSER